MKNKKIDLKSYMMIIALVAIWIIFAVLTNGVFITTRNISNLFRQMTVTGIASLGMAICIIAGYFDLSIGSIIGATGALTAVAMVRWDVGLWQSILMALIFGLLIGLFQGLWVAYGKVPAFIVTLGGQLIFRGVVLWLTDSNTIALNNPTFIFIGQGYIPIWAGYVMAALAVLAFILLDIKRRKGRAQYGFENSGTSSAVIKYIGIILLIGGFILVMNAYQGVPFPLVILIVIVLFLQFMLTKTRSGRYIYAVGGNAHAARLSGINNEKVVLGVFALLGLSGAISGIVSISRLASAMPSGGNGLELDAIASCVIGGISLSGGKGSVKGAIVGALVMTSLSNGMSLMSWDTWIQNIIKGLVLIFAVWFDIINSKKAA